MEEDVFELIDNDGNSVKYRAINEIEDNEGRHYLIYTHNKEYSDNDNIEVYVSEIVMNDNDATLINVSDEKYNEIKKFLDSLVED